MSKQERYFSGMPNRDPRKPLPGEISPEKKRLYRRVVFGLLCTGFGVFIGIGLQPGTDEELEEKVEILEEKLIDARAKIEELKRDASYKGVEGTEGGALPVAVEQKHLREGAKYITAIRSSDAQAAADLMGWFLVRWNKMLDIPGDDDRVGRRAQTLSQLVGGMAKNLHPGDYVPWQAEFFGQKWLAELHYDLDGDGLPTNRKDRNRQDGFSDTSICNIAMSLNQSLMDAQVLVMPDMQCDNPENRVSMLLSGRTWNDALNTFVKDTKDLGFLVVERKQKGVRMILVGNRGSVKKRKRR